MHVITLFCAKEQKETQHVATIAPNGDIVLTCQECGNFVKLPPTTTAEELKEFAKNHKLENEGQVNVSMVMSNLGLEEIEDTEEEQPEE